MHREIIDTTRLSPDRRRVTRWPPNGFRYRCFDRREQTPIARPRDGNRAVLGRAQQLASVGEVDSCNRSAMVQETAQLFVGGVFYNCARGEGGDDGDGDSGRRVGGDVVEVYSLIG